MKDRVNSKSNLQLFQLLLPYFKPHSLKILIALLLIPLSSITFAAQPYILQRAIDDSLKNFNLEKLYFYVLLLFVAVFLNFIVQSSQFWLINLIGQNSVADLRLNLFDHLQKLPMTYFDKTPVGRNVSRITSDIEQLSESFAGGVIFLILDIFNVVGILIFMFLLNWKLCFVITFFLIPIVFLIIKYQTLYRTANLEARKKLSEANSFLQQNIVGISVVHALNSVKKSIDKFAISNKEFFDANDATIKADSQLSAYIELVSFVALVAMIFMSSLILKNGILTIGTVLAFLQYTQALFEPIRNLSDRFSVIQSAFTAAERVDQLLEENLEKDEGLIEEVQITNEIFSLDKISFRYSRPLDLKNEDSKEEIFTDWVLKDLSLVFEKNKKYALVGRTGCGKSTIVKLLTRLYEIDSGEIFFCGKKINKFKKNALRSYIAVIHQDSYIFAGTLRDNIKLNRHENELDWEFIKPLLSLINLDLESELSERATNISSGEAQVINFARALITKPEVIVLDEATAKIDIKTEQVLQKFLEDYLQARTAIIIAHRLETIKNCDQILFLRDGEVIEKGSHEELLLAKGDYFSYQQSMSLTSE
jgi:ATP-binding cassette subfamily B protein